MRDLMDMVRALSVEVQELRVRVNQTSRNSSKPPSSDPPNAPPPPAARSSGRKRGAQPGHPDRQRPLLPPEQVDELVQLHPTDCPVCHTTLPPTLPDVQPPQRTQVWELPPISASVTEFQHRTVRCPTCRRHVHATRSASAPPGAFGPRLTALIGLLHGRYRLSTRETCAFLAEVAGVDVSVGSIVRSCDHVSVALAPVDATIQATIAHQPLLHVDETGWREGSQRGWLWVAASAVATCFRIDRSRGRQALQRLIGEAYGGLVHSDRGSAYTVLPNHQRQLCWAHLVRNLPGVVDQGHVESPWAQRMIGQAQVLFAAWHAYQGGFFDQVALQMALIPVRMAVQDLLQIGASSSWSKLRKLARELQRHWEALWWFSRVEGAAPTNNTAERTLRPAVLWRKSCFGTQSSVGSRFVERILSVRATCVQQGRDLFAFLTDAVTAAWAGHPAPVLVATP